MIDIYILNHHYHISIYKLLRLSIFHFIWIFKIWILVWVIKRSLLRRLGLIYFRFWLLFYFLNLLHLLYLLLYFFLFFNFTLKLLNFFLIFLSWSDSRSWFTTTSKNIILNHFKCHWTYSCSWLLHLFFNFLFLCLIELSEKLTLNHFNCIRINSIFILFYRDYWFYFVVLFSWCDLLMFISLYNFKQSRIW